MAVKGTGWKDKGGQISIRKEVMAESLYHMVQASLWETAKAENKPYTPPTYEQVRPALCNCEACLTQAARMLA